MQITGNSLFTCLTRKNTKGKMPSNAYEVGVEIDNDFSILKTANDKEQHWLTDYIGDHTKDIKYKGKDGKEVDKRIFKISNATVQALRLNLKRNSLMNLIKIIL